MEGRLTPEELAAIRQREQAATPGPWKNDDGSVSHECGANAVFLAEARMDVPRLLTEVDALKAELHALIVAGDRLDAKDRYSSFNEDLWREVKAHVLERLRPKEAS